MSRECCQFLRGGTKAVARRRLNDFGGLVMSFVKIYWKSRPVLGSSHSDRLSGLYRVENKW